MKIEEIVSAFKKHQLQYGLDGDSGLKELYKWELVTKQHGHPNTDVVDFANEINSVQLQNLCYPPQLTAYRGMAKYEPEECRRSFRMLFTETVDLQERIDSFTSICKKLSYDTIRNHFEKNTSAVCDEQLISCFLTLKYPDKYTLYKSELYSSLCNLLGIDPKRVGYKLVHFYELLNKHVVPVVENDKELMDSICKEIDDKGYIHSTLLVAQTALSYYVCTSSSEESGFAVSQDNDNNITKDNPMKKYSEYIDLLIENHNLVLTGAPGTGKTFMAQAIAEEMGCSKEEMCFVQFHPSYDYTDFVEGLRPISDGKGDIGFERKDGIFKVFCKRALSKIQPKVHKTTSKQQNTFVGKTPFEKAYRKLILDINAGSAVSYSDFRSMRAMKLKVDNKMNFQTIRFWKTKDYQNAQYDYLKRLYMYYYSRGIYDIRNERFDDFVKIIGNTLDYSYYRGIVQGLLDRTDKNQDVILNDKPFVQNTAEDLMEDTKRPYVFIIDEINRGEISKIFGELFYAIDPGYRGETGKVKTQYQNLIQEDDVFADGFYVPDNVYIIGTMNDIDRSVESMDFAMRRRFTWKEVTPTETQSMLDTLPCADMAKNAMNRLNEEIAKTEGLGAAYMVGPAYFLKLGNNGGDFQRLWKMNIEPLLKEYLRGFRKTDEILKKYRKAYFKSEETSIDQEESDELE